VPRFEREAPVSALEYGNRRHERRQVAGGSDEVELLDERARAVLGAPRRDALRGRQHHRRAAAAGQTHLGFAPRADR